MLNKLIEYMKIHKISLEQDLETALRGEGYESLTGQIIALGHIIEVATDILNDDLQGKGY